MTVAGDNGGLRFAPMMGPVAHRLLGAPNERLSRGPRLRFGSHGSVEVDTTEGWFDDHEAKVRGGVLDLIRHKRGGDVASAFRWMEDEGLKERQPDREAGSVRSAARLFYDYADEQGEVLFRVERRGKDAVPPFLQHGPDGRGGFHAARGCMQDVRRVLYRLPELLAAPADATVFVCEGEKDVDNLRALGFVATTNPGGAGKFTGKLAAPLAGKTVVALQDNDDAGANHVAGVLAAVEGIAGKAVSLLLPGLPPKGDVTDWLKVWGADAAFELERLVGEALTTTSTPVETFPIADLAAWATCTPEPKRFVMAGFIPEHEVTLFTGSGGTNKSTFGLQLASCSAAGFSMLGTAVQPGPALYVTAEDEDRENHWRLAKIATTIGTSLERLAGKLHVVTLRGRLNNELATFDTEGRLKTTAAFKLLRATLEATSAKLLVLDNVGHLFVGNENDRGQVTAFVNLLYQLCRELGVTILLIAHPNKEFLKGNKVGNATSGSTAWLNAVRSQITIERAEGLDPDARTLSLGKANYARPDQQLSFRWHDFALIRDDDLPADRRAEIGAVIQASNDNAIFLACLAERTRQRRAVSDGSGTNYAPAVFADMPESKGIGNVRLKAAMERLFRLDAIEKAILWRDTAKSRDVSGLRPTGSGTPPTATPDRFPTTAPDRPQPVRPTTAPNTHPPKGGTGAGLEAPAPALPHIARRSASGMILAPGETGNEPVPGFEDLA